MLRGLTSSWIHPESTVLVNWSHLSRVLSAKSWIQSPELSFREPESLTSCSQCPEWSEPVPIFRQKKAPQYARLVSLVGLVYFEPLRLRSSSFICSFSHSHIFTCRGCAGRLHRPGKFRPCIIQTDRHSKPSNSSRSEYVCSLFIGSQVFIIS